MAFVKTTWIDRSLTTRLTASQLNRIEQGIADAHSGVGLQLVTALPGSPVDGQQVLYLADDTNGVVWHLRYRAFKADGVTPNPSAYKWEVVGAPPFSKTAATGEVVANSGNAWVDLSAAGAVPVTLPLGGDYVAEAGISVSPAAQAQVNLAVWSGANGTGGTALTASVTWIGPSPYGSPILTGAQRLNGLSAGVVRLRGSTNGNSVTYLTEWLKLVPVRVG